MDLFLKYDEIFFVNSCRYGTSIDHFPIHWVGLNLQVDMGIMNVENIEIYDLGRPGSSFPGLQPNYSMIFSTNLYPSHCTQDSGLYRGCHCISISAVHT